MLNIKIVQIILFFLSIASTAAVAVDKADLNKLKKRCEDAREKKIAPLRQAAIKECAAKDRNTRDAQEKCERFYVDYGAGAHYKSGGHRERMFNDLPECLKFYEAEKAYKKQSKR